MPADHHDLKIIKLVDATSYAVDPNNPNAKTDDGLLLPAVRDHGLLLPAVQTDEAVTFTAIALAESGGNPDAMVDGRDFLIWQRGNATPGPDDNVGLPAVQTDNGLLLPAVQDHALLLPAVRIGDGEANTPGALLFRFESDPVSQDGVHKGSWITDVTYELLGQPTVATETVTIAHEGFLLI
jgi:hypothetical protein